MRQMPLDPTANPLKYSGGELDQNQLNYVFNI